VSRVVDLPIQQDSPEQVQGGHNHQDREGDQHSVESTARLAASA
jgi:hypothetical protein